MRHESAMARWLSSEEEEKEEEEEEEEEEDDDEEMSDKNEEDREKKLVGWLSIDSADLNNYTAASCVISQRDISISAF